ncbi:hypothetical protein CEXT_284881 [Caerostris extrusa]|uniref:Uncharacterized protein n=1 Tax=Caerostris extrusa TaxID=172846 RepID=A0AAV4S833_CAEEX|nr:hypothetical protein CEXT_284881 [Caerostris extrusa]
MVYRMVQNNANNSCELSSFSFCLAILPEISKLYFDNAGELFVALESIPLRKGRHYKKISTETIGDRPGQTQSMLSCSGQSLFGLRLTEIRGLVVYFECSMCVRRGISS